MSEINELIDLRNKLISEEGLDSFEIQKDPRFLAKQEEIREKNRLASIERGKPEIVKDDIETEASDLDVLNQHIKERFGTIFDRNSTLTVSGGVSPTTMGVTSSTVTKARFDSDEEFENYLIEQIPDEQERDVYKNYLKTNKIDIDPDDERRIKNNIQLYNLEQLYKSKTKQQRQDIRAAAPVIQQEIKAEIDKIKPFITDEKIDEYNQRNVDFSNNYSNVEKTLKEINEEGLKLEKELKPILDRKESIEKFGAPESWQKELERIQVYNNKKQAFVDSDEYKNYVKDAAVLNKDYNFLKNSFKAYNNLIEEADDIQLVLNAASKDYLRARQIGDTLGKFFFGDIPNFFTGLLKQSYTGMKFSTSPITPSVTSLLTPDLVDELNKNDALYNFFDFLHEKTDNYTNKYAEKLEVKYPKPLKVKDIDSLSSFATFVLDAGTVQSASIATMMIPMGVVARGSAALKTITKVAKESGKWGGAAIPKIAAQRIKNLDNAVLARNAAGGIFYTSSSGSEMSRTSAERKIAPIVIGSLEKQINDESVPNWKKSNLKNELEAWNRRLNISQGQNFIHANIFGAAEGIGERFGTLTQIGRLSRSAFDTVEKNLLLNIYNTAFKGLGRAIGVEFAEETITQTIQDYSKKIFFDPTITIFDNLDADFFATVAATRLIIAGGNRAQNVKNVFADYATTRNNKRRNRELFNEALEIENQIDDINAQLENKGVLSVNEIKKLNTEKINLLNKQSDLLEKNTIERAISMNEYKRLTPSEREILLDIESQLSAIRVRNSNLSGLITDPAEKRKAFNQLKNEYELLIDKKDIILKKNSDRVFNQQLQLFNDIEKIVFDDAKYKFELQYLSGVNQLELELLNVYAQQKGLNVKAGTLEELKQWAKENNLNITDEQFQGKSAGIVGNNIFINQDLVNEQVITAASAINPQAAYAAVSPIHEILHHRLQEIGFVDSKYFEQASNELFDMIELAYQAGNIKESDYRTLIKRKNRVQEGEDNKTKLEEFIIAYNDSLRLGILSKNDLNTSVYSKMFFNSIVSEVLGDLGITFKIKTGSDLKNFLDNFNKNVNLNKQVGSRAEEPIDEKPLKASKAETSIIKQELGDKMNDVVGYDSNTTNDQFKNSGAVNFYTNYISDEAPVETRNLLDNLIKKRLRRLGIATDKDIQGQGINPNVHGYDLNPFLEEVKMHLYEGTVRRFDPKINDDFAGFLASELDFRIGNISNKYKKGPKTSSLDVPAGDVGSVATPVADDTTDVDIEAEQDIVSELTQGLKSDNKKFVNEELADELETNTLEIIEGVTPEVDSKDLITYLKDASQQKSFKTIKNKLKDLNKFLEDNYKVLFYGKNLPIAVIVALERQVPVGERIFTGIPERLTKQKDIDKAIEEGDFHVENEKQGPMKYPRKKPTLEQILKFFNPPAKNPKTGKPSGLKGTRKDGIVNAIAFSLFRDYAPQTMNKVGIEEKDIAKVSQRLIVDPRIKASKAYKNDIAIKFKLKNYYDTDTMEGVNKYIADIPKLVGIFEDGLLNKTILVNSGIIPDPMLREYARAELDKIPELKIRNKKYTKTKFSSSLVNKSTDKEILDLNKRNTDMFVYMWTTVNKAIQKDKSIAVPLLHFFTVATNEGTHPHRLGAPLMYIDKNISSYYFEHALQNVKAWRLLIETSLEDNKNNTNKFSNTLKSLMNNYKLIAISKQDNTKLDKSNYVNINGKKVSFKDEMGEIDGKEWNIFDNFWWQRYYNEIVGSMDGGISTSLVSVETGKTISEELGIDEKGRATNKNIETSKQKAFNKNPKSKFSKAANIPKLINDLNNYDKALRNARNLNAPKKGISIFDFDDTLATSKSKVIVTVDDKTTKITPAEFAKQHSKLEEQGAQFDFSEFNKVIDGKPGPLAAKLKKAIDKFGNKDVFVLTARPQASAQAIYDFLKGIGLEVPLENITGLEDGTPQAKANWVVSKAAEGYNDFYFTDDVYKNVKAVQDVLEVLDVKSKTRLAYSDRVKKLDKDFNDILEAKTGIASEKEYSPAKAQVVGANKGKFNFFIPPSAEDFVGLLYSTLGKGKLGDSQMAWYKKNLLDPYASAMAAISRERITLMDDYKALKKQLGIVPKNLRKKIPGENFTNEQGLRVYIWNKQGMNIPGLSKTDLKELTDYIESNTELKIFGDQLIAINKSDGYAAPTSSWLGGTITTDIMRVLGTTKRAKHLQQWQQNVDIIFSEKNLNKLEAAFGRPYRVALEKILQRMETGVNRSFTGDTKTGKLVDWLTNSIGTIMFFNTRSALLQTISAVNFINFSDNNIFKAGKAYANQKQFWSDFMTLMNSEFLVDRRRGLRINVNEADIANMANQGGARGVVSKLLEFGFLPTQIADSFAIASGGATFYRNRINTYKKQGLSEQEAQQQAFNDFREIAEESQQSSRPDRISQEQAGPLGRIILAFANTPAQYARLIKKAALDLKNRRGDVKTNISKIIYYGFVQNLIFNALQQAVFAIGFGDNEDEEDEKEKYTNVVNGMLDSLLRGMGLTGAYFSVGKNMIMRVIKEQKEDSPEYEKVVADFARLSPPISSKFSRLRQAGRTFSWEKEEMREKGFAIDNPALQASANVISAATNIPIDRLVRKANNINTAVSQDLELWERFALLGGWQDWELGIDDEPGSSGKKVGFGETRQTRKRVKSKRVKQKRKRTN